MKGKHHGGKKHHKAAHKKHAVHQAGKHNVKAKPHSAKHHGAGHKKHHGGGGLHHVNQGVEHVGKTYDAGNVHHDKFAHASHHENNKKHGCGGVCPPFEDEHGGYGTEGNEQHD